jgi:hypothetical protein
MSEHHDHHHHHHHEHEKVQVTVTYTGKKDFEEAIAGKTTFGQVKLSAMGSFGLDPAAADHYALQFDHADVDDTKAVDSLHREHLKLRLTLSKEPKKG